MFFQLTFRMKQFLASALITLLSTGPIVTCLSHESQSTKIESRIAESVPIDISKAPYQVSVRDKYIYTVYGFGSGHYCGGSVVSQRLVITAARCVWNLNAEPPVRREANELILVMGAAELYSTNEYTLRYDVQKLAAHPKFNATSLENDIAALFLNESIPWNWPTVTAIPLNKIPLSTNTQCEVTGWGKMANDQLFPVLLTDNAPIIYNHICVAAYASVELSHDVICAGHMDIGGFDACHRDVGGPLVCDGVLVGIVSWGIDCKKPGYPNVYSNISHNYNWIKAINYTFHNGDAFVVHKNAATVILKSLFLMLISHLLNS